MVRFFWYHPVVMSENKRNRITRKMVNDALRGRGRDESLREGDG